MAHISNPIPADQYVIPSTGDPECGGKFCELRGCAIIGRCGAPSNNYGEDYDRRLSEGRVYDVRAERVRDVPTGWRDLLWFPHVWVGMAIIVLTVIFVITS